MGSSSTMTSSRGGIVSVGMSGVGVDPTSYARGAALAIQGLLRGYARTGLDYSTGTSPTTSATVLAEYRDYVTITSSAAANGTPGSFTVNLATSGSGFSDIPGFTEFPAISGYMLSVGIGSTNQIRTGFIAYDTNVSGDGFGTIPFSAPVTFGQEFLLQVQLIVDSQVTQPSIAHVYRTELDMFASVEWLGIDEVRDDQGTPVAFDVVSESGTDWSQPVPEPAISWPCVVAFFALVGGSRRRSGQDLQGPGGVSDRSD